MSDKWVPYTPGDPVPDPATRVRIRCRDDVEDEGQADDFVWGEFDTATITHYRVIEPDVEWIE